MMWVISRAWLGLRQVVTPIDGVTADIEARTNKKVELAQVQERLSH